MFLSFFVGSPLGSRDILQGRFIVIKKSLNLSVDLRLQIIDISCVCIAYKIIYFCFCFFLCNRINIFSLDLYGIRINNNPSCCYINQESCISVFVNCLNSSCVNPVSINTCSRKDSGNHITIDSHTAIPMLSTICRYCPCFCGHFPNNIRIG